ncbi:MAG: purine-nucleoside phosphorylase [Alphaproteobacteria bacterium]|nr:MAG: purine-nucleoside phosphorylase [Alphaproteobacteria bacterium]
MTAQASATASADDVASAQAQHKKNVEISKGLILSRLGSLKPKIAIILGSGLGGLGDKVQSAVKIPYKDLPGFPIPTIIGHSGELIAGKLNGVDVIALKGRKHFYETNDPYPLKTMIRTMKAVGVETLFVSNAAGSLRADIGVSQLMLITDHINYMAVNPLIGANDDDFGPRFPPMTDAWDPALRAKLKDAAKKTGVKLHEGVYIAFRGPTFETPAEIRMAITMGAQAVGMSSVPDCIIARHCGLKVVGCSLITNMGAGLSDEKLSHAHTLEMAARGAADFEKLVAEFVRLI